MILMAAILVLVWGGFAVILITAMRKESAKRARESATE